MKAWRHPSLIVTALLALFASFLPSQGWSCPVTGRVGSAAWVCEGLATPCAAPGSKCCRPVTLALGSFALDPSAVDAVLSQAPQLAPKLRVSALQQVFAGDQDAILSDAFFSPPCAHLPAFERAASSWGCISRHGPPRFSGRAPPLV